MIEYEHQPFMTVTEINPEMVPYVYFKSNCNFLFPKIDINKIHPEIPLLVNTIESYFEDLELYLTLDLTDEQSRHMIQEHYDELIIVTQRSEKTKEEAFCYTITPLGSFYFDFFQRSKDNQLSEKFTVFLTDEMKEGLYLVPCEVDFLPDGGISVFHEYLPSGPFPPLRPEKYPEGSPQQLNAKKYYEIQELKYSSATSVYYSGDEESDLIDEVLAEDEEYWEDDDYDEDEIEDFLNSSGKDFFHDDTLDTLYYVVRPED